MQHIRTEDIIIIDIETVSEKPVFSELEDYWQQLWQGKVEKQLPADVTASDFYEQRAGVMAEFSKIVCISMGYFMKEPQLRMRIKSFYGHDEKIILTNFLETMLKIEGRNNKWCFAGHNIKEFDIPFICRRLLINRIPIPRFFGFSKYETLGNQFGGYVSILEVWRL